MSPRRAAERALGGVPAGRSSAPAPLRDPGDDLGDNSVARPAVSVQLPRAPWHVSGVTTLHPGVCTLPASFPVNLQASSAESNRGPVPWLWTLRHALTPAAKSRESGMKGSVLCGALSFGSGEVMCTLRAVYTLCHAAEMAEHFGKMQSSLKDAVCCRAIDFRGAGCRTPSCSPQ